MLTIKNLNLDTNNYNQLYQSQPFSLKGFIDIEFIKHFLKTYEQELSNELKYQVIEFVDKFWIDDKQKKWDLIEALELVESISS